MKSSPLEDKLFDQMTEAGIPLPERQQTFHPKRRWRVDFLWRDLRLVVEVEGGTWTGGGHVRGGGFRSNVDKYNALQLMCYRLLRVTTDMIRDHSAILLIQEAIMLFSQAA